MGKHGGMKYTYNILEGRENKSKEGHGTGSYTKEWQRPAYKKNHHHNTF
jgi:hypothetical protein